VHQNEPFQLRMSQNFLGRGTDPSPDTSPLGWIPSTANNVLAVNSLTFLLKYSGIAQKRAISNEKSKNLLGMWHSPLPVGRETPLLDRTPPQECLATGLWRISSWMVMHFEMVHCCLRLSVAQHGTFAPLE